MALQQRLLDSLELFLFSIGEELLQLCWLQPWPLPRSLELPSCFLPVTLHVQASVLCLLQSRGLPDGK